MERWSCEKAGRPGGRTISQATRLPLLDIKARPLSYLDLTSENLSHWDRWVWAVLSGITKIQRGRQVWRGRDALSDIAKSDVEQDDGEEQTTFEYFLDMREEDLKSVQYSWYGGRGCAEKNILGNIYMLWNLTIFAWRRLNENFRADSMGVVLHEITTGMETGYGNRRRVSGRAWDTSDIVNHFRVQQQNRTPMFYRGRIGEKAFKNIGT